MQSRVSQSRQQGGFTLVEILIALTIGILTSATIVQIYISSQNVYRLQDATSRLQENARFALGKLSYEVRMAGLLGCANQADPNIESLQTRATPPVAEQILPLNWNVDRNSALVTTRISEAIDSLVNPLIGSDAITIVRASVQGVPLARNMVLLTDAIYVAEESTFQPGDYLVISDCRSADIFRASNVLEEGNLLKIEHTIPSNRSATTARAYSMDEGTRVYKLEVKTYYVSFGTDGDTSYTLREHQWLGGPGDRDRALADDVENMRLEVAIGDSTGAAKSRVPIVSANLNEPAFIGAGYSRAGAVVGLTIHLLMRTNADHLASTPNSIDFLGSTVNSGTNADRRIRRLTWQETALRNRLPWIR